VAVVLVTVAFGVYIGFAPGRPLFIFMLLIMIPLATTELGTDSWITSLMAPAMTKIGLAAGWVLVYTSFIMMVLRFFAGPIVHRLSPLGLLATSALIAGIGLVLLSRVDAAVMILLAATVYGLGKTFFWPTMLGVVSEQSPRGGALTLNATGGVGMLGVGVVGAVFLGYIQDTAIEKRLEVDASGIHSQVVVQKRWVFGRYEAVDPDKAAMIAPLAADPVALSGAIKGEMKKSLGREPNDQEANAALAANADYQFAKRRSDLENQVKANLEKSLGHAPTDEELQKALAQNAEYQALIATRPEFPQHAETMKTIDARSNAAKKRALASVAIFPGIMLVCYLILLGYFKTRGGYKAEVLTGHAAEDKKFTGGVPGPVEA
jgi:hypothetical protein